MNVLSSSLSSTPSRDDKVEKGHQSHGRRGAPRLDAQDSIARRVGLFLRGALAHWLRVKCRTLAVRAFLTRRRFGRREACAARSVRGGPKDYSVPCRASAAVFAWLRPSF